MMPSGDWRELADGPGYWINRAGDVYSEKSARLLSHGTHHFGYPTVGLKVNRRQRTRLIHVLLMEAFVGPRPAGMEVRHLDGDPQNHDLSNLTYGTHSENVLDTVRHGRHNHASLTACKHGHEFTPENTWSYEWANGKRMRQCKQCTTRRAHERKAAA